MIACNGHAPREKKEAVKFRPIYWPRQATASGYSPYLYILYLKHDGAILMTPCMSLPVSTTTAGELLKSVTFYNDIKCINT